jgi:uncharacterized cupredoxin-like copper-binding protein
MIEPAATKDIRCHSPRTVADQYETPTLGDMTEALTKFPRYETCGYVQALAHESHDHFSAGEPGNPQKLLRTVNVSMLEEGKRMLFDPPSIEVQLGEQIRFVLFNEGSEYHEFVLATHAENRKHAELMKKFPKMEHNDPNAKRLSALSSGELLWKFTRRGEFEYACLIPGHFQAGMHGKIIVK